MYVQGDGNVVVYDCEKQPVWASNTDGQGEYPYRLIVQDDGNLVLYDNGDNALFATGTSC